MQIISRMHACRDMACLQRATSNDVVKELATWHQLHHHIDLVDAWKDLPQINNEWMVELGHDLNFAFDLSSHVGAHKCSLIQHLCCPGQLYQSALAKQ